MSRCQFCGTDNPNDRTECQKCNAPVSPDTSPAPAANQPSNGQPTHDPSPYGQPASSPASSYQSPYNTSPPPPRAGQPGAYAHPSNLPGGPNTTPNLLPWAIVVTLCCCLIGGVVSIVYASRANSKAAAGDAFGAAEDTNTARIWIIVSAILGGIIQIAGVMYRFKSMGQS